MNCDYCEGGSVDSIDSWDCGEEFYCHECGATWVVTIGGCD